MQACVCVRVCLWELEGLCVSVCVLGHYAGNVTYLKFMYFLAKRQAKSKDIPYSQGRKENNKQSARKKANIAIYFRLFLIIFLIVSWA